MIWLRIFNVFFTSIIWLLSLYGYIIMSNHLMHFFFPLSLYHYVHQGKCMPSEAGKTKKNNLSNILTKTMLGANISSPDFLEFFVCNCLFTLQNYSMNERVNKVYYLHVLDINLLFKNYHIWIRHLIVQERLCQDVNRKKHIVSEHLFQYFILFWKKLCHMGNKFFFEISSNVHIFKYQKTNIAYIDKQKLFIQ